MEKRMPQLNRWLPLIGLVVLIATSALRLLGAVTEAEWVESIGKTLKLPVHSPIGPVEVAAAIAALYGVGRKLYSTFVEKIKGKSGWNRWVPLAATAGLVLSIVLRARGQGAIADMLDSFVGVHAPVSPLELGAAATAGYGLMRALYSSARKSMDAASKSLEDADR